MVSISFSDKSAAQANLVGLLPVNFNFSAYQMLLEDSQFWRSFMISVERVVLGTALNLILSILMAYPLSKNKKEFGARNIYMNLMIFAMLFSGGMIPIFIVVKNLGLIDTIWSLILPGAVPIFNVILLMNFFKSIPKSLEEAAIMDGASKLKILFKIYLPISLPALATIGLFSIVGHWNDYFSGLLYMNSSANYPLQTYIQQLTVDVTKVTDPSQLKALASVSNKTLNAAKIVVSIIPVLLIYPLLQKYFVSGLVIGSVKE
jgi:putative aldouronate transport system permease protein